MTGRRGEAIRQAVHDQLGLTVVDVKPVGLEGSGGSTPAAPAVEGDPDHDHLFAKLYAMNHVRADRWYKLGRTILYGRLEDETRSPTSAGWSSTRTTRCGCCATPGIPTATPGASSRSRPEREYMLVTEFIDGAREIGDADVDRRRVIDEALAVIRRLWDAGLAHRDIKPANLLVRDGQVFLIDVALRPGPTVAVAPGRRPREHDAGPRRAHRRRTRVPAARSTYFTADDIAEAFAATAASPAPPSCGR